VKSGNWLYTLGNPLLKEQPLGGFAKRLDGGFVLPLEEQPLGRFAPPAVGAFEMSDQFGGRGGGEVRRFGRGEAGRSEAVEAAAGVAAGEIKLRLDAGGERAPLGEPRRQPGAA